MPQHLALIALTVRDYDEAIAFYTQKLGFTLTEDSPRDPATGKRWVRVAPPGSTPGQCEFLLARAVTPQQLATVGHQTGGRVFVFIHTDNFQRDYQTFLSRGVTFVRPPKDEPYGTVAVFQDLYGNLFDLIQPACAKPE